MSRLQQLQRDLQRSLLQHKPAVALDWIDEGGRAEPDVQWQVYLQAYAARLKEVLAEDFAALAATLGQADFDQLCANYIAGFPSRSFTLREFGRHLPGHLRQWRRDPRCAGWAELADFEWRLLASFDAPMAASVSEQDLAGIPNEHWPQLRLSLQPAVQRIDHHWNSVAVWQAHKHGQSLPSLQRLPQPQPWLIWREGLITRFVSLTEPQRLALDAVARGECFAEICEGLGAVMNDDEIPLYAASLLKSWIHNGLITQLQVGVGPTQLVETTRV